ncbi:cellulase family glycosylhydrolase [Coraliomargarita sp. SDUM461004]|uniref:Cellulase family glycosylhydrolase n=1 Tax=Thalassobacterium sedimentorum TaxID=3041258 RepID=A0ABU1AIW8_9BACT|nr:cellulase family glycosylhydrolase [Coraliomargarita sp. SDUM461004]MDQ8194769.1 cellulase family glycosylhydrolase [Coraliomargarita sp. SDUM461004]
MKHFSIFALSCFLASAAVATPVPGNYDYPEQPGRDALLNTDPSRGLLNDGRAGVDGPSAVWGEWGVREFLVDWNFGQPMQVDSIVLTITRANESSQDVHPQLLKLYPALTSGGGYSAQPLYTIEIPFQAGRLQNVRLDLPGTGLAVARLRMAFETDKKQIVLSEVSFNGRAASRNDIAATQQAMNRSVKAIAEVSSSIPSYHFPDQNGLDHLVNTDPTYSVLTDGHQGTAGNQAVWSKWGTKEMVVDWDFGRSVRIKSMKVAIVHSNPNSENSHASAVSLYGRDTGSEYLLEPDFQSEITFEAVPLQEVRLVFSDGGIVTDAFRTVFQAGRFQVVLSEVTFELEEATKAEAEQAQRARENAQPEVYEPVVWFPSSLSPEARVFGDSIFGVCGHFLHTNAFMSHDSERFNNHWRPSRTLPWLVDGNFNWVRETLYMTPFNAQANTEEKLTQNRQRVEDYIQRYQDRGVKVLLAPMFGGAAVNEDISEYAQWVGSLARRFSAVQAVELHNEPNLKGFWLGTPQQFVDAAREFAGVVKQQAPEVTIIAGSFAGWGGAWNHPDLRALVAGDSELATKYAEEVFKLGLLEFVDAVSAHPYRGVSAPEGGDVIESRTDPEGFEKEVSRYLDMAQKYTPGNKRLPLYLTEIGYSVSDQGYTNVPDEARQADYYARTMLLMLGMRLDGVPLDGVFWYDLKQDEAAGDHYESNFGIVSPNASRPRPAWLTARRVNEFYANNADFVTYDSSNYLSYENGEEVIKSYLWSRKSDEALIVPFWRMNQLQKKDVDFDTVLTLRLPNGVDGDNVTVRLHDLHEDRSREVGVKKADYDNVLIIPLHVTARPAWLEIIEN